MSLDVSLHIIEQEDLERQVYWANITHNLNRMADAAGIYGALWRPAENGFSKAADIIKPLEAGLVDLKERPGYYEQFNATNGCGLYKHLVPFVEEYLEACKAHPDARISASI